MSDGELVPRRIKGRSANGSEVHGGTLFHAVEPGSGFHAALCGTRPAALSAGWSAPDGSPLTSVTCQWCFRRLGMCPACKGHGVDGDESGYGPCDACSGTGRRA